MPDAMRLGRDQRPRRRPRARARGEVVVLEAAEFQRHLPPQPPPRASRRARSTTGRKRRAARSRRGRRCADGWPPPRRRPPPPTSVHRAAVPIPARGRLLRTPLLPGATSALPPSHAAPGRGGHEGASPLLRRGSAEPAAGLADAYAGDLRRRPGGAGGGGRLPRLARWRRARTSSKVQECGRHGARTSSRPRRWQAFAAAPPRACRSRPLRGG